MKAGGHSKRQYRYISHCVLVPVVLWCFQSAMEAVNVVLLKAGVTTFNWKVVWPLLPMLSDSKADNLEPTPLQKLVVEFSSALIPSHFGIRSCGLEVCRSHVGRCVSSSSNANQTPGRHQWLAHGEQGSRNHNSSTSAVQAALLFVSTKGQAKFNKSILPTFKREMHKVT